MIVTFVENVQTLAGIAGEGMGLYLVHTLVRSYGGSVSIERRDPRGTVATVELPRA